MAMRQICRQAGSRLGLATARGLQTSPGSPDRVVLQGLVFHGYHGVLAEEQVLGQKFKVDAALSCSLRRAGCTDELEETVNYAQVYSQIKQVMEGEPCKLVEAVAERIADTILEEHPLVSSVHIRVQKPHVAVDGVLDFLGIEITRHRQKHMP